MSDIPTSTPADPSATPAAADPASTPSSEPTAPSTPAPEATASSTPAAPSGPAEGDLVTHTTDAPWGQVSRYARVLKIDRSGDEPRAILEWINEVSGPVALSDLDPFTPEV